MDWSFDGGNCSFPGIMIHPRSMMLIKCTGKTSTDVLSCGSVVILSICLWNRRADFSVKGTGREERRRERQLASSTKKFQVLVRSMVTSR